VNGSIYTYKKFKNIEKNHIITDQCFKNKEWENYYKNQLENKNTNNLILITDKNTNIKEIQKKLTLSNYKYNKLITIHRKKRAKRYSGKNSFCGYRR
jgi:hypothetical protein